MRPSLNVPTATATDFALAAVEHCNAALAQLAAISDDTEDGEALESLAQQADVLESLIDALSRRYGIAEPRRFSEPHLHVIAAE